MLAFAFGVSAGAWVQVTLRWVQLSPRATGGAGDSTLLAALLLGVGLGAWLTARLTANPFSLASSARSQLLFTALCAGVSAALATAGWSSLLVIGATGAALGAATLGIRSAPAALLLGGATGWAIAAAATIAGVSLVVSSSAAVLALAVTAATALILTRRSPPPAAESTEASGWEWGIGVGFAWGLLLGVAARGLAPYVGRSIYASALLGATALVGCAAGARLTRGRPTSIALLGLGVVAAVATLGLQAELEWILPGLVRRTGGLASFPRAVALTAFVTALGVLPTTILLFLGVGERALRNLPSFALGAAFVALAGPLAAGIAARTFGNAPFEQRYGPLLHLRERGLQTILVTDDPEQGRILRHVDGASPGGVGTDPEDRVNAQVAMLLHPSVTRVLQLGFGVGNGASSILAYPIERLDVVDPEESAPEIAAFFDETNLDVLSDARLVLHEGDPWTFLARTDETWDVVRLTASELEAAHGTDLPTVERLGLARSRLAPGGIVSLRVNVGRMSTDDLRTVIATMAEVFPEITIWDGPLGYNWVIHGSDEARPPDPELLARWREDPDVDAEIGSLGLDDAGTFFRHLVMANPEARAFAHGAPVATTPLPRLDASATRSPLTYYGLGAAAADTALGDLTDEDGRENVGVARLFQRLTEVRALKRAASERHRGAP